jgi:hypothetical protein
MATKTFKIGECAVGGILVLHATKTKITAKFLNWDNKRVVDSRTLPTTGGGNQLEMFVADNATCYWGSQAIDWVTSKGGVPRNQLFKTMW